MQVRGQQADGEPRRGQQEELEVLLLRGRRAPPHRLLLRRVGRHRGPQRQPRRDGAQDVRAGHPGEQGRAGRHPPERGRGLRAPGPHRGPAPRHVRHQEVLLVSLRNYWYEQTVSM